MSLDEISGQIDERENQLEDLASYFVKVRVILEVIYTLINEILELERLLVLYVTLQVSR